MSDEPTKPVTLRKGATEPSAPTVPPPRTVLYAVIAMAVSGVSALVAAIDLYLPAVKRWVTDQRTKSIRDDLKDALKASSAHAAKAQCNNPSGLSKADKQACTTYADHMKSLAHDVSTTQKGLLISVLVAIVALGFIGFSTYRGRYWARWGVLGLWFLGSFTNTLIGIQSALAIAASIPLLYKIPAFLASAALIAAVLLTNLRPSVEYFAAHRPAPPEGRAVAGRAGAGAARPRRGLFAPPPPRENTRAGSRGGTRAGERVEKKPATTRPAITPERSRSKQRANTAAVAKGAELARTRAKAASKSRRTEN